MVFIVLTRAIDVGARNAWLRQLHRLRNIQREILVIRSVVKLVCLAIPLHLLPVVGHILRPGVVRGLMNKEGDLVAR